jgi:DNA-directed RNA polymerase specialized sigma24 family protein
MRGPARRGTLRSLLKDGYYDLKRILARRLGSVEAAGDVLHETYLRLERFDGLAPVANPRAYLLRMALNAASDHERAEQRALAAVEIEDLWRLGDDAIDP